MKEQLEYEALLNKRIRSKDRKLRLSQESYRARDMIVDEVIRETLENKIIESSKRKV